MLIFPILASDTTGAAIVFLGMVLAFGLCSLLCIPLIHFWGRRTWWGLVIALIPTLGGAFFEFYFLTVTGGAPGFVYVICALPLLVGLRGLLLWRRPREEF